MSLKTSKASSGSVSSTKCKESDRFEDTHSFDPLESRTLEVTTESGAIKKWPALHKKWTEPIKGWTLKGIRFYLPSLLELEENETAILNWKELMEILRDDLKWLLKIQHYQFWSVMVYCPEISNNVLSAFLIRAPRFYDIDFQAYQNHEIIGPLYREIYELVFRIYMRLATYRESKEDHISIKKWGSLLYDNYLFDIPKIQDLCALYEGTENPILPKMIENVLKNEPKFIANVKVIISVWMEKSQNTTKELETKIQNSFFAPEWDKKQFQDFVTFQIDSVVSLYKFIKVYPNLASEFLHHLNFIISLATCYESNVKSWSKVLEKLPCLDSQVYLLRAYSLRLFRAVLAGPTVLKVESSNDSRLDQFFESLTACLEEKLLIHDYEKAFPFKIDIQDILSRGIFVDETRIDYMANAISSCFFACGEEYSVDKIVVDPLYDPNFDRQLLGACSLDVTGVELQSLISQVKDLLPDLPDSYVEAVLKHYSYTTETTINALLEGSVPPRLEKYKNEDYVKSQMTQTIPSILVQEDPVRDELPVRFKSNAATVAVENGSNCNQWGESFHLGKRSHGYVDEAHFLDEDKAELKGKIVQSVEAERLQELTKSQVSTLKNKPKSNDPDNFYNGNSSYYIDESLMPNFRENIEYDDEYDDTYDEVGVGMTEPDNYNYNPLNRKADEINEGKDTGNDDNETDKFQAVPKNLDNFVEDPAILRAQYERRREEKAAYNQQRRGQQPDRGPRDVVGKAKGQGQDKDVLLNRRQKTIHGDHNRKKRSDFKRKEF